MSVERICGIRFYFIFHLPSEIHLFTYVALKRSLIMWGISYCLALQIQPLWPSSYVYYVLNQQRSQLILQKHSISKNNVSGLDKRWATQGEH